MNRILIFLIIPLSLVFRKIETTYSNRNEFLLISLINFKICGLMRDSLNSENKVLYYFPLSIYLKYFFNKTFFLNYYIKLLVFLPFLNSWLSQNGV